MIALTPKYLDEINRHLAGMASAIPLKSAIFISGSISSGKRFLEWYLNKGKHISEKEIYKAERHKEVIEHNQLHISNLANKVRKNNVIVIEPSTLEMPHWGMHEYLYFWKEVIIRHAKTIVFSNNWEYSDGCNYEFYLALLHNLEMRDENGNNIAIRNSILEIKKAIQEHEEAGLDVSFKRKALAEIEKLSTNSTQYFSADEKNAIEYKDEMLNYLANNFNIAQFASFSPSLEFRFARIAGREPNNFDSSLEHTIEQLIQNSEDKSVNIRTFKPDITKGNPFHYGIKDAKQAAAIVRKEAKEGFYTIVNETIDVSDGGVSGVLMNNIIEFAPNDTPKCVEKEGICSLPREIGMSILRTVYGFAPDIAISREHRVEFSIHPKQRGFKQEHTIVWEVEKTDGTSAHFQPTWPNNFSRFIGDKTFGLLIANELGINVPQTTVVSRNVAPFSFGKETNCKEKWFRTCPYEKIPGKYPTYRGWHDPFTEINTPELLQNVPAILSQSGVNALFSGAAVASEEGVIIEGVHGYGDNFMIGTQAPTELPIELTSELKEKYLHLHSMLGPVNFEWVFNGKTVWIVQLSINTAKSDAKIIYPGEADTYITFEVGRGLEELRALIPTLKQGEGIELIGKIGITSHFGDILRNAKIPARLA